MARKRNLDLEAGRLWRRLSARHNGYPDTRKSSIISAYRGYRDEFGSRLVSEADLGRYLKHLFQKKGEKQGYAAAMHLRDALRNLWGDDAARSVTRHVRDIQQRAQVTLQSDWDAVRTAAVRLPAAWQERFGSFISSCETEPEPAHVMLSPFTLKSMAEALVSWARFRESDTRSPMTGAELNRFAEHLQTIDVWPSAVLSTTTKVYMCYTHVLTPGFRSIACQAVLRELKGRALIAGPCQKRPSQFIPASLIYQTGLNMIDEAQAGSSHDIHSATVYRNGLLLAIAAAVPLRRRALASLDLATSFRLEERPVIQLDIAGRFLKLREGRKSFERYQAHLTSPILWKCVHIWAKRFRPVFDEGTSLFPSARVRGEALVPEVLGAVFRDNTEARLGVRVPIHRIRDCVATEAIEEMANGADWARHLLGHKSAQTTEKFYDHSTGLATAREFGQLVGAMRSDPADLLI